MMVGFNSCLKHYLNHKYHAEVNISVLFEVSPPLDDFPDNGDDGGEHRGTSDIAVFMAFAEDGTLQCQIQWRSREAKDWVISWEKQQCEECASTEGGQKLTTVAHTDPGVQDSRMVLPGIAYDAKYWAELHDGHAMSQQVIFHTPKCLPPAKPSLQHTVCLTDAMVEDPSPTLIPGKQTDIHTFLSDLNVFSSSVN